MSSSGARGPRSPRTGRGHVPRKRFGQHFLHDSRVLARIVDAIAPRDDDNLIEIGPGEGALTAPLLDRVAHLQAIEIDRDLAAALEARYPRERLTVHCADALEFDFSRMPAGMRLVGNLPYNVSTPLLFHLAQFAPRIVDMHFMLQLEVVERMVAAPATREYGRLSVALQVRFGIDRLFRVPPGAFRPAPKVDSAVVRLVPLAAHECRDFDPAALSRVLIAAFAARRKTLRNALPLLPGDYVLLDIDPQRRPDTLSPAEYVRIANLVAARADGSNN